VAYQTDSLRLSLDYLKKSGGSILVATAMLPVNVTQSASAKYISLLNNSGENVFGFSSWLGNSYLGLITVSGSTINSMAEMTTGIVESLATVPQNGGQKFTSTYQNIGVNLKSDWIRFTHFENKTAFAFRVNFVTAKVVFSSLYQKLGFDLREDVIAVSNFEDNLLASFLPDRFSVLVSGNYFSEAKNKFTALYQKIGFVLRADSVLVANFGKSLASPFYFNNTNLSETGSAVVYSATASVSAEAISKSSESGWFYRVQSFANKASQSFITKVKIVRTGMLLDFKAGLSFVGGIAKLTYQNLSLVFSKDSYSGLWTRFVNGRNSGTAISRSNSVVSSGEGGLGIAVLPSQGVISDELVKRQIKDSFSDDVEVIADETGRSGIIKPNFKSGRESSYVYVLVPVDSN